jgi:hypothetical protein
MRITTRRGITGTISPEAAETAFAYPQAPILNGTAGGASWLSNSPSYTPIIPGAAGHAMSTTAASGRDSVSGGLAAAPVIYFITNLNLSGPGSLWDAFRASGRRIIIPCVSGVIDYRGQGDLNRQLVIGADPFIYAGQCAPSPGLATFGLQFLCNLQTGKNSLFWHLSAYQDQFSNLSLEEARGDVVNHHHPNTTAQLNSNIVHANCWYSGSSGEIVDLFYGCDGFSMWQCVIAEALYNTNNVSGSQYGYGVNISNDRTVCRGDFTRCAFIHNSARNPRLAGVNISLLNNLLFDFNSRGVQLHCDDGVPIFTNIEGNLFVNSTNGTPSTPIFKQTDGSGAMVSAAQTYLSGNRAMGWNDSSQSGLVSSGLGSIITSRISASFPTGYTVTPIANRTDFARLVAASAGARPGDRLATQARVMSHLEARLTGVGDQGGNITAASQFNLTAAQNTVDHTTGSDPIPGITTQSSTPTVLGVAGRAIQASTYTALEEWLHRRHNEVMS